MNPITRDTLKQQRLPLQPNAPKCGQCGGRGFINCPEATVPTGDYISIALRSGTACDCAAGSEFAEFQMKFMSMED